MSFFLLLISLALVHDCAAINNTLGLKPPLGWRSWNCYHGNIDQALITKVINTFVDKSRMIDGNPGSLWDVGFQQIGVDDNWQVCMNKSTPAQTFHNGSGWAMLNTVKFPNLTAMVAYAHSIKVRVGWYFNNCICRETHPPFRENDTRFLRMYDFDGVKLDGCGSSNNVSYWSELINSTGRPLLIEDCHNGVPTYGTVDWCPMNFFRSSSDINNYYPKVVAVNLQSTRAYQAYPTGYITRPGCWAYPDMLEVGNFPPLFNATPAAQDRSHLAAWATVSSPLILGFDVTNNATLDRVWPLITNKEILAVSQNWAGHPGRLIAESNETLQYWLPPHYRDEKKPEPEGFSLYISGYQIWAKPQPSDGYAVLLMNLNGNFSKDITVQFSDVPMPTTVKIRDIFEKKDLGTFTTSYTVTNVQPFDSAFLLLSPA